MSVLRASSIVLLALLGLAAPVAAQAPPAGSGWLRVESPHFTLFGNRAREELVEAVTDLEQLRDVLTRIAPDESFDAPVPTYFYLFRDAASFAPFRLPGAASDDGGYLVPGEDGDYAAAVGSRPTHLVYRQYVLELLHRQLPGLPAWLAQGLAEYYSTFEVDEKEARIGLPPDLRMVWSGSSRPDFPPVETLVSMQSFPVDQGSDSVTLLAEAWGVVDYLMAGDVARRRRIGAYIRRVEGGEDPVAAFRGAFETDFAAFEKELYAYHQAGELVFLRVPVATAGSVPVEVRPLGGAETAFRLGDLLLHLGPSHRRAAEERLRKAVALDPEQGAAWAALGRVAEEGGEPGAALEDYERALALAPDDVSTLLRYGRAKLLSLGGRRASDEAGKAALAAARDAFRRASELRPDSGEAWAGLGQAGVLAAEPDPDAPAALEKAVELLPAGRTDVLYNLLLADARAGDGDGVDRALDRLRAAGADEALLVRARQVRLQVDLQEAYRLATHGRIDDAVALLAVVRAESRDPGLAAQATALYEKLTRAEAHNRFADGYMEAVRLYHDGDLDGAARAVDAMLATAEPGRQTEALEDLRARIEAERPEADLR